LPDRLTLADARRAGLIDAFAKQEEARGIGPVSRGAFNTLSTELIKRRDQKIKHRVPHPTVTSSLDRLALDPLGLAMTMAVPQGSAGP
jgi:hypothetical protein